MLFNIWRPYPFFKPKVNNWYTCTLEDNTVLDLYYIEWADKWLDSRRQTVFDGYKVYKSGRGLVSETRVYDDALCDRTYEVIAWKHVNKAFRRWRKK